MVSKPTEINMVCRLKGSACEYACVNCSKSIEKQINDIPSELLILGAYRDFCTRFQEYIFVIKDCPESMKVGQANLGMW